MESFVEGTMIWEDLNVTNETNKLPSFIEKKTFLLLKPNIWGSSILPLGEMGLSFGDGHNYHKD
jgi:hypothetical protein